MTPDELQAKLSEVEKKAQDRVAKLAEQVRYAVVLPFCYKHRYEFSSGMGSWSFNRVGNRETILAAYSDPEKEVFRWDYPNGDDDDGVEVPWPEGHADMVALLNTSCDLMNGYGIGTWMKDICKDDLRRDPSAATIDCESHADHIPDDVVEIICRLKDAAKEP